MLVRPGDVIAERFAIEKLIGSGGMGSVFRAADRARNGVAAVKIVRSTDTHVVERFTREAMVLERLVHPTIVGYIAHGRTPEGSLYLAMEWLEGDDLGTRLDVGRLSVADTIAIASQVAKALGVAHAAGVVHRDIKPSNLFLVGGKPEQAKLLDFGIAKLAELDALTKTGALVGTPLYMAPEQIDGSVLDPRTDVFALGAVMFHCLTGRPPFPAKNLPELVSKLASTDEAPRVRATCAEVSPALDELIARMLSKDPARRPANGDAVGAALVAGGVNEVIAIATADTGIVEAPAARVAELLGRGGKAAKEARWNDARTAFEAAIAIEDSYGARLGLANVLPWLNEMNAALGHFERAYVLASKSNTPEGSITAAAIALMLTGHHYKTFGNPNAARGWLARAKRLIGDGPHPLRTFLTMMEGASSEDPTEAVRLLSQALAETRATKQRDMELMCLAVLGGTRVISGDIGGMAMIDEAMAATMAGEYEELNTVVGVACSMVTACDAVADMPRLLEWCGAAEKFADRFGCPYLYSDCRWHYGSGLVATGKWDDGERELSVAIRTAPVGTVYHTGAVTRLADLRVRQGRLDDAEQLLASVGDKPSTRGIAGAIKHARGQHAAASALLQRFIDGSGTHVHSAAMALELLVEVSLARGDLDMARFASKRLMDSAADKTRVIAGYADIAAGRLALADKDQAAARKRLERAIDLFTEHGMPHEAARARFLLAQALATHDAELARDEARAASNVFTQLGATNDASAAAELLRTL